MCNFGEHRLVHFGGVHFGRPDNKPGGYEQSKDFNSRNVAENFALNVEQRQLSMSPDYKKVDTEMRCLLRKQQDFLQGRERFMVKGTAKNGAELGANGRLGLCNMKRRRAAIQQRIRRGCPVDMQEYSQLNRNIAYLGRKQEKLQREQIDAGLDFYDFADRSDRGLPQPTSIFRGMQTEVNRRRELPSAFEGIAKVIEAFINALAKMNKVFDDPPEEDDIIAEEDREAFFEDNDVKIQEIADNMGTTKEDVLTEMRDRDWGVQKFTNVLKQSREIKKTFADLEDGFAAKGEDAGGYKLKFDGIHLERPYGRIHEICNIDAASLPVIVSYDDFKESMRMRKEGFLPRVDKANAGKFTTPAIEAQQQSEGPTLATPKPAAEPTVATAPVQSVEQNEDVSANAFLKILNSINQGSAAGINFVLEQRITSLNQQDFVAMLEALNNSASNIIDQSTEEGEEKMVKLIGMLNKQANALGGRLSTNMNDLAPFTFTPPNSTPTPARPSNQPAPAAPERPERSVLMPEPDPNFE